MRITVWNENVHETRGDEVVLGEVLAEVHASDDASAEEVVAEVLAAYELGDDPPAERRIVLDTIG